MKRTMVLRLDIANDDEYGETAANIVNNPHVTDWYCSTTNKQMHTTFHRHTSKTMKFTKTRLREAASKIRQ